MHNRPWYKRYPSNFISGTMRLSLEQKGAYSMVLDLIYDHGGPIPDDSRWIARVCGCSTRKWNQIRQGLIGMGYLHAQDAHLTNRRAEKQIFSSEKEREKLAENGAKGAEKTNEKKSEHNESNDLEEKGPVSIERHTRGQRPEVREREEEELEKKAARGPRDKPPDPALRLIEVFDGELTAAFGDNQKRAWAAGDDFVIAKRWLGAGLDPEDFKFLCQSRMRKKAQNGDKPPSCLKYLDTAVQDLIRTGQLESSDRPDWRSKPRTKSQIAG